MAQSMNTKVDLTMPATSYTGFANYGKILVGDKAFEYYNDHNVEDYIQIPWEEISYIAASVYFNKKIARFAIFLKKNEKRYFSFSAKDNKAVLWACKAYIPEDRLQRSPTFFGSLKRGILSFGKKKEK